MSKRSTLLIVIGVAVFVLGAGLVVVSLHGGKASGATQAQTTAAGGSTAVVVTTGAVTAGTSGESLIESKRVSLQAVPAGQVKGSDVTSLSQLEQQSLVHSLPSGTVLQASDLSPNAGPIAAPAGDESIAVTLPSAASGLAGYLQPGSEVDVYANVVKVSQGSSQAGQGSQAAKALPCVSLVASKVQILDVSDVVPAYRTSQSSAGRSVPGNITVLMAVTPAQAPTIVYFASNEQLYLAASNQAKVTPSNTCVGFNGGAMVPVQ